MSYKNEYIFSPVFINSDLIRELIGNIDLRIPEKYMLTNINQNGKIIIKDDETFFKTIDSLRYHGVKHIPDEVYQYIEQQEDDRLDLNILPGCRDYIIQDCSQTDDVTFGQSYRATHECNNFNMFKLMLESIYIMDSEYKSLRLDYLEIFNYFSEEWLLFALKTYPKLSEEYLTKSNNSIFYCLLGIIIKRDLYELFRCFFNKHIINADRRIFVNNIQYLIRKCSFKYAKHLIDWDIKKNPEKYSGRDNPDAESISYNGRLYIQAYGSNDLETVKYLIEKNKNYISENDVFQIVNTDNFEILKYIFDNYNGEKGQAYSYEIVPHLIKKGRLDMVKYAWEKECRVPLWMNKQTFEYDLNKYKYSNLKIKNGIQECLNFVFGS